MNGGDSVTEYDGAYAGPGAWPYGGPAGAGGPLPPGPAGGLARAGRRPPHRRRRALVAVAAALVVVVVGTAVGVAHGGRSAAAGTAVPTPGSAASSSAGESAAAADLAAEDAAAWAILDRRAAALQRGSLAGWLADVDPTQPALVAQQRMLFANLRRLPLALFRYGPYQGAPRGPVDVPPNAIPTSTSVQADYSMWVGLAYQFRGFDREPVVDQYLPIFVRRDGAWLLAGDQTSTQGDYRWVEPWDKEPIAVGRGRHSLVVVSARDARRLPAMVAAADSALSAVASMWPVGNHQAVLYDTRNSDVFATYLGSEVPAGEYAGVTRGLGQGQTHSGDQDLRVVVNAAYDPPGSSGVPALLRHEFTHVAKWGDQGAGTPLWASEGIAEYTAYRSNVSAQRVSSQIGTDASHGRLPRTEPTDASFYAPATTDYDYGFAWCTFEYISEQYSESKVRALYEAMATISAPADSAAAVAAQGRGFRRVLGISQAQFVRRLDAWITQVIRPVG